MKESQAVTRIVRPLRGGQITIPSEFRKSLGIDTDSLLQISLVAGELRIRPLTVTQRAEGSPWLKELSDQFAPVREEAGQYPEAEIDAAIDKAVRAVRQRND
jgi:bifunctional DNA-binding transcriptional regulator/antitoxin component of YhaV-PrlF toxin-antitoxin module